MREMPFPYNIWGSEEFYFPPRILQFWGVQGAAGMADKMT
jgi:hypothetical protein